MTTTGCHRATPSAVAQLSVGVAHPWSDGTSRDGVAVDAVAGSGRPGSNDGTGFGLAFHRAGRTQELALALHHYQLVTLNDHIAAFARGSVNLIEWDRVGSDDGAGIGGLAFELGVGAKRHPGPCLVLSVRRDFRFNDPDDTFLGAALGMCAITPAGYR